MRPSYHIALPVSQGAGSKGEATRADVKGLGS